MNAPRKKSPRAPSIPLGDALDKAMAVYDRERRHAAPPDVVAQHLGYKNAKNGAALTTLASLKYYGLLDRAHEGLLSVPKGVEEYKFAPKEEIQRSLVLKWLQTPTVFADLLTEYPESPPSVPTLKFNLIKRGFSPQAADTCADVFLRSVEYARFYDQDLEDIASTLDEVGEERYEEQAGPPAEMRVATNQRNEESQIVSRSIVQESESDAFDRIPVRLRGGRRAWLEIPVPFFEADKVQLRAQIDLLITNDEDE